MVVGRDGRRTAKNKTWGAAALLVALALAASACGGGTTKTSGPVTLRLGYFPNLTHAPAMIGLEKGFFKEKLGSNVTIDAKTFNAGPDVVTAIFSGALDISYVGPNPAINAWSKSKGQAIKIIAGTTSGGAELVTKPSITTPAQLKGKTIASPQLGNTQDVALRSWLKTQGYATTEEGGGDVKVKPQPNAQTIDTYKLGQIDGAWVPEPFASRLVVESGARVLVSEASLWPEGKFVTTHVIVRTAFLKQHPDVVENFLRGHVEAIEYANANPDAAQSVVNTALEKLTGKPLKSDTIKAAWKNLTFTVDPISSSLHESAKHAEDLGLLDPVDLKGIYDLAPLNKVLGDLGKSTVTAT
jgi:NitT/TauT family transport system substrate-binding protein